MARLHRVFLPQLADAECRVEGSEAHHMLNVLRLKPGQLVEVFDGAGRNAEAEITETSRRDVTLVAREILHSPDQRSRALTLAVALPKPERTRWMVEKLTELGVTDLVPLKTQYSESTGRKPNADRLTRYVVDACKQSGRNWLMRICEPVALDDFLKAPRAGWLAYGDQQGPSTLAPPSGTDAVVLIGPEGGFSDQERSLLNDCGADPVSLGTHVLRVETAAVAAAVRFGSC